jgi:hypothetical protein
MIRAWKLDELREMAQICQLHPEASDAEKGSFRKRSAPRHEADSAASKKTFETRPLGYSWPFDMHWVTYNSAYI